MKISHKVMIQFLVREQGNTDIKFMAGILYIQMNYQQKLCGCMLHWNTQYQYETSELMVQTLLINSNN